MKDKRQEANKINAARQLILSSKQKLFEHIIKPSMHLNVINETYYENDGDDEKEDDDYDKSKKSVVILDRNKISVRDILSKKIFGENQENNSEFLTKNESIENGLEKLNDQIKFEKIIESPDDIENDEIITTFEPELTEHSMIDIQIEKESLNAVLEIKNIELKIQNDENVNSFESDSIKSPTIGINIQKEKINNELKFIQSEPKTKTDEIIKINDIDSIKQDETSVHVIKIEKETKDNQKRELKIKQLEPKIQNTDTCESKSNSTKTDVKIVNEHINKKINIELKTNKQNEPESKNKLDIQISASSTSDKASLESAEKDVIQKVSNKTNEVANEINHLATSTLNSIKNEINLDKNNNEVDVKNNEPKIDLTINQSISNNLVSNIIENKNETGSNGISNETFTTNTSSKSVQIKTEKKSNTKKELQYVSLYKILQNIFKSKLNDIDSLIEQIEHKLDYYDIGFVRSEKFLRLFVKSYCESFLILKNSSQNKIYEFDRENFEYKSKILAKFLTTTNHENGVKLDSEFLCLCAVYEFIDVNCHSLSNILFVYFFNNYYLFYNCI